MKVFRLKEVRSVVALVTINILIAVLLFLLRDNLPPEIPLFYGAPAGREQLAPSIYLALPPILAATVSIINAFLSFALRDDFLKQIFLGVSVIVTALSSITVIKILLLVGNL